MRWSPGGPAERLGPTIEVEQDPVVIQRLVAEFFGMKSLDNF